MESIFHVIFKYSANLIDILLTWLAKKSNILVKIFDF